MNPLARRTLVLALGALALTFGLAAGAPPAAAQPNTAVLVSVGPNPSHQGESVLFQWTATGFSQGTIHCSDNRGWVVDSHSNHGAVSKTAGVDFESFTWTVVCEDDEFAASGSVAATYVPPPPPDNCENYPNTPGCEWHFGSADSFGGDYCDSGEDLDWVPCGQPNSCPVDFPNCTCPAGTTGYRLSRVRSRYRNAVDILRFDQLIFWCWNSTRITKVYRVLRHWITPPARIYWSYQGVDSNSCETEHCIEQAGDAKHPVSAVTISARGKFTECYVFHFTLCWDKYLGLWMRIHRGGAREYGSL